MLFVPAAEAARWAEWRRQVAGAAVLTVTDADAVWEQGGMVALRPAGRRLGFAVNLGATRAAGLRPQAQLLKLAIEVREQ
jgi:hypothetical protein